MATGNPFGGGNSSGGSRDKKSTTPKISWGQVLSVLHERKLPVISKNLRRVRNQLIKKASRKRYPNAKDISTEIAAAPWQIIYGRMRTGGTITYKEVKPNIRTLLTVHTIAAHEIDAVETIIVDNTELTFGPSFGWCTGPERWANKVYAQVNLGTAPQTAFTQLVTDSADCHWKWTAAHNQHLRAGVYLKFVYDDQLFDGEPEVYFQVRGKKCWDPRVSQSNWTANAALVVADYMQASFGLGVPSGKIDMDRLSEAADECDVAVAKAGGGQEGRYAVHGVLDSNESPRTVLENLLSGMAGSITYVEGKYRVWPAVWRAPTVTLTEDDLRSTIRVQTLQSRRDAFNTIKGTFVSQDHNYEETDFPPVTSSFYVAEDGGEEIVEDVSLPFTTSSSTAQRVCKVDLERVRQGIVVEAAWSLKAMQLETQDTVNLDLPRFGWEPKIFEVLDYQEMTQDGEGAPVFVVRLVLKETASAVFDWNSGMETLIDLSPNTALPNPFAVEDPTDLALTSGTAELFIRADGTVFSSIKASWTAPNDAFINSGGFIEVQHKPSSAADWQADTDVPGDQEFARILDVQDGVAYDVRIRSLSALGSRGNWVTAVNHVVAGKTEPPSDVTGFEGLLGNFGIVFSWAPIADKDVSHYELRVGISWDAGTLVSQVRGTSYRLDTRTAGGYVYWIKAVDTSGNYSLNATSLSAVLPVPAAPVTTFAIQGPDLVLSWSEPQSTFKIDAYEIRYGDTYETSALVGATKSTVFRTRINWGGTRRFWVAARDVHGNLGDTSQTTVIIVAPGNVRNLTATVIDNNVFLKWEAAVVGTLPIDAYRVYKGTHLPTVTADGVEKKGDVSGTFAAIFELAGGTFTYWVVALDTAGNLSVGASVTALVDEPPDFVLLEEAGVDPRDATTSSNIYIEGFGYLTVAQSSPGGQSVGLLLAITSA